MRLQLKAHHDHLSDSVRAYAEKRLSKLDRRLYEGTLVEVTLSRERNPSIADDHSAEAIVYAKGSSLVAREHAATYEAAIDRLVDKLERQIERYRAKRKEEPRRGAARQREDSLESAPGDEQGPSTERGVAAA
jgi:ribosome hibernation promoting factor